MAIEDYKRLIEDFCASAGIDDVGAMLHRGLIDVDDVSMQVEYLNASENCRVLADLGEIPAEHQSELCAFMLESNFDGTEEGFPVLSIHPETGRAVLAVHLSPAGMLADGGLMQAIEQRIQPLIEWWNEVIAQMDENAVEDMEPAPIAGAFA